MNQRAAPVTRPPSTLLPERDSQQQRSGLRSVLGKRTAIEERAAFWGETQPTNKAELI
jgi:hypothetical protein